MGRYIEETGRIKVEMRKEKISKRKRKGTKKIKTKGKGERGKERLKNSNGGLSPE